jgi:hypothetical protein
VAARLRKFREATFESADGVVSRDEMFRAFLEHSPPLPTPAAPFKGGFAAFFDGASTPLLFQEGNTLTLICCPSLPTK